MGTRVSRNRPHVCERPALRLRGALREGWSATPLISLGRWVRLGFFSRGAGHTLIATFLRLLTRPVFPPGFLRTLSHLPWCRWGQRSPQGTSPLLPVQQPGCTSGPRSRETKSSVGNRTSAWRASGYQVQPAASVNSFWGAPPRGWKQGQCVALASKSICPRLSLFVGRFPRCAPGAKECPFRSCRKGDTEPGAGDSAPFPLCPGPLFLTSDLCRKPSFKVPEAKKRLPTSALNHQCCENRPHHLSRAPIVRPL